MAIPDGFKVSTTILKKLPEGQRPSARADLWEKAAGICALCGDPLPADGKKIDIDHHEVPEGAGGETKLSNLYLAHSSCNRSRQKMPIELARRIIPFERWCGHLDQVTFKDVVEKYVPGGNQPVKYEMSGDTISIGRNGQTIEVLTYEDPATATRYFFAELPITWIQNDEETQPRDIEADHVRALAADFWIRPVHEPSNCRLISGRRGKTADLLQFDGQHKSTAQIILGRNTMPFKVYVEPDEAMLQELVVQIQQGIKKRPLSTSDTLRKLDVVIQDRVKEYVAAHGKHPSEAEIVEAQPDDQKRKFRRNYLENIEWAIMRDPDNRLTARASKKANRNAPLTETVLQKKLIRPLVYQGLLDEPLDASTARDMERRQIIALLNQLDDLMLDEGKWDPKDKANDDSLDTKRARRFFMQGPIGWWSSELLIPLLQAYTPRADWERLFHKRLTDEKQEQLASWMKTLTSWPIWSTDDKGLLQAMRSNTVSNISAALPEYDQLRLSKEAASEA